MVVPASVIRPVYTRPSLPKWHIWTLPHRSDVILGDRIRLLGYRAWQSKADEVREISLTLYWRCEQDLDVDYSAFVHLVDGEDELLAQSDIGLGADRAYPSSAWWVGDIVPSEHNIVLPSDLPVGSEIRVGAYFWADLKRLSVVRNGSRSGNYIVLSPLEVGLSTMTGEVDP
jgi:hypothetical protein